MLLNLCGRQCHRVAHAYKSRKAKERDGGMGEKESFRRESDRERMREEERPYFSSP